jgi:hypothetical protein
MFANFNIQTIIVLHTKNLFDINASESDYHNDRNLLLDTLNVSFSKNEHDKLYSEFIEACSFGDINYIKKFDMLTRIIRFFEETMKRIKKNLYEYGFCIACESNHKNIAEWLTTLGVIETKIYNQYIRIYSSTIGLDEDILNSLKRDPIKGSPFWACCTRNHVELAKWLCDNGFGFLNNNAYSVEKGSYDIIVWLHSIGLLDESEHVEIRVLIKSKFVTQVYLLVANMKHSKVEYVVVLCKSFHSSPSKSKISSCNYISHL